MKTARKSPAAPAKTGIAIDLTVEAGAWPPQIELEAIARKAADCVLAEVTPTGQAELSIIFSDDTRIKALNSGWRGKDKPTNVLSFPAFPHTGGKRLSPMLGDVVMAAETVAREAAEEAKPLADHIAHLIVHGILHLIGYDHETDPEAEEMEATERRVLARMGIPDPYR